MDDLSKLPTEDTTPTPEEEAVMEKHFGSSKGKKMGWMNAMKLAFYALIVFLVFANPWIDSLFCMVPYCGDSSISLLALKSILFMFTLVLIIKFT
jgi:polyferredoxin